MKRQLTRRNVLAMPTSAELKAQIRLMGRDPVSVVLLAVATFVLLAMVAWFYSNFAEFPDLLPLHFDAQGNPDRIGERSELRVMLVIATVVYVVNTLGGLGLRLFARMTFAPYLLWSGALLVEGLVWVALRNVVQ